MKIKVCPYKLTIRLFWYLRCLFSDSWKIIQEIIISFCQLVQNVVFCFSRRNDRMSKACSGRTANLSFESRHDWIGPLPLETILGTQLLFWMGISSAGEHASDILQCHQSTSKTQRNCNLIVYLKGVSWKLYLLRARPHLMSAHSSIVDEASILLFFCRL